MIPFYIFYSMFGFQCMGDQMWTSCELRGCGFANRGPHDSTVKGCRVIKEMGVDPDKLPRLRFECQPLGANKIRRIGV
jgi:hypothetical protein